MTPRRLFTLMLAFCAFVLLAPSARAADGDPVRLPAMPTASTLSDRDQKRVDTYYERAATRFEKGDLKGALKAAKQVYALLPNASTALLNAQLLAELNRHCEAFDMSLLAMDLDPTAEEQGDARAGLRTSGARCDRGYGWSRVNVKPVSAAVLIAGVILATLDVSFLSHAFKAL